MSKKKVLIVDDSQLITDLLTKIISADENLEVVGTASDPFIARDKIKHLNPDVITLDIEMPRMDGLTFLKNIMRLRPTPVVMISTLTQKGADATLEALENGAVDFVGKPVMHVTQGMQLLANEICSKVRAAAKANVRALERNHTLVETSVKQASEKAAVRGVLGNHVDLIAMGASTGGTEALKAVVCNMPAMMPPIVIVQHMPENFTRAFAERMNVISALSVEEFVADGTVLEQGKVYVANGATHMEVRRTGRHLRAFSVNAPPVNRHRPAVDVLFDSVASWSKNNVIGVLLTGMGADGARGLGELRAQGAETIAQDEASSVVWGMPRVAVQQNAASKVLSLSKIGTFLVNRCYQ